MANQKDFRVKNGLVVEEGAVIAGLVYPTSDSTSGYVLKTDGAGNITFSNNINLSGTSIDSLSDVDITTTSPTNKQALIWDSATSKFKPGDSFSQSDFNTAFGLKSIDALADVDTTTTTPLNNQALIWNSSLSKFVPGDSFSQSDFNTAFGLKSINALSDVDTISNAPTSGQALVWNGTNFIPGNVTADFLGLTDTPNSFSGQANRVVKVNNSANGIEFGDLVSGSQSREVFTGNGTTTVYTLANTYGGQNSVLVYVDGVIQYPGANYTLSGTTLTFLGTPLLDSRIEVFGLTPVTAELTPGDGTVTAKKLAASAYTRDIFTGNGTATSFNLTGDVGTELAPFVYVGGILQDPGAAYNIDVLSNPQTITFTEAIPNATEITVVYGPVNVTGVPSDGTISFQKMASSVFAYDTFTGDGTDTTFTLSQSALSAKHLLVSVASVLQTPEVAYTVSGTTLTFSSAPPNGAPIIARYFVAGVVSVPTDNSVSTIKLQDGSVTKAKLAFNPEDDAVALAIALG